jgi:hypothetical protein
MESVLSPDAVACAVILQKGGSTYGWMADFCTKAINVLWVESPIEKKK